MERGKHLKTLKYALLLAFGGSVVWSMVNFPEPAPGSRGAAKATQPAPSVGLPEAAEQDPKMDTELDTSIRKTLAVSIILNGHGCHKVEEWSGEGAGGENVVTCVERKGGSKLVRYKVDPLKGIAVPL